MLSIQIAKFKYQLRAVSLNLMLAKVTHYILWCFTHYTIYTVSSGPLYCLEDISNHMLAGGGEDGIKLWKWDELTRNTKVHRCHFDTIGQFLIASIRFYFHMFTINRFTNTNI